MSRLTLEGMTGFYDELQKEGAGLQSILGGAGAGGGAGLALGGLAGAGVGAVHKYREARREGATAGEAVQQGLGGAVHGGLRGAALGGLAGAAGGAALGHLRPGMADKLVEAPSVLGAGARFGQRQTHALTGWKPEKGLESIRGGAWSAMDQEGKARGALEKLRAVGAPEGKVNKAVREHTRSQQGLEAARELRDRGLTSLPGYLGHVREHGLMPTLAADVKGGLAGMRPTTKALLLGAPALGVAQTLAHPESAEGPGKAERIGSGVGAALGGLAGSAMPLGGQLALGAGLGAAGKGIGRGVDWMRHRGGKGIAGERLDPHVNEGQAVPTEHIMSAAARGQAPEGIV